MFDLCGHDILAHVSTFLCQWDVIQLTTVSRTLRKESAIPLRWIHLSTGSQRPAEGVGGLLRCFPNLAHIRLKGEKTVQLITSFHTKYVADPSLSMLRDILKRYVSGMRSVGVYYVDKYGLHAHTAFCDP